MKKLLVAAAVAILLGIGTLAVARWREREQLEQLHYEQDETEFIVSNASGAPAHLFRTGKNLADARETQEFDGHRIWLPPGNYFLRVDQEGRPLFHAVPIVGFRGGPDPDGALTVTVRFPPPGTPPRLLPESPEFAYVPSGHFLLGDRLNPQEPHYVWLTAFFASPFEVTNQEFAEFLHDPSGYADDSNWVEAGRRWKSTNSSQTTAQLDPTDEDFLRFGQPDQPVVRVNWFEANAFCRWLTKKVGGGRWTYALPNEAEWEKAARGPDGFDYALGMSVSDEEVGLYNWKKNPGAPVTVVGIRDSRSTYAPNRYGLYHMTGNVTEWTQSVYRTYNRQHPYAEDERNHDDTPGLRVVRGGSWYTASVAVLYIPYRETFQPEVSAPYLGFRVIARLVP